MKDFFTFLLAIILLNSCEQKLGFDFLETNYNIDGSVLSKKMKHFDTVTEKIDIYFYKKYFYEPANIPDSFSDKRYKNDTVIIWSYKGDQMQESSKSYIYDSLSRVLSYAFSGCMVCSNYKYDYKVIYNTNDQPTNIKNNAGNNEYDIRYNNEGKMIELNCYSLKKIFRKIEME
jgi:hypothetical protein